MHKDLYLFLTKTNLLTNIWIRLIEGNRVEVRKLIVSPIWRLRNTDKSPIITKNWYDTLVINTFLCYLLFVRTVSHLHHLSWTTATKHWMLETQIYHLCSYYEKDTFHFPADRSIVQIAHHNLIIWLQIMVHKAFQESSLNSMLEYLTVGHSFIN